MASKSRGMGDGKPEDGMTAAGVIMGSMFVIFLLIWFTNQVRIVNFWAPKFAYLSQTWLWLPGESGKSSFYEVVASAKTFLQSPKDVSIFSWIAFINKAIFLPVTFFGVALIGYLIKLMFREEDPVKRGFKPQQLAQHLSHVFTGVAPVLHLRKALAQDKEPLWRRQLFPHEVLLNVKVNDKPIVVDEEMSIPRATEYFMGIVKEKVPRSEQYPEGLKPKLLGKGRLISTMLGRQVVHLLQDKGENICFPERFTNAGKVIYALLCAHAFGGEEGKADYAKARDQLNNSARGAAHGMANLAVAQWIFDKYKNNQTARKLFAVHHWEYTYLFELLVQAKRQGKCGHWEFMWLKPTNRILFYVMNTVGRFTPHTESAAAFTQYVYERRVLKMGRLPLMEMPDGSLQHVIYVDKAVKGLGMEWERWRDGEDDDHLWWTDDKVWKFINEMKFVQKPPPPPPAGLEGATAFDSKVSQEAEEKMAHEAQALAARAAANAVSDPEWD